MNFVAIDFETANRQRSSICAVGLAYVRGGQVVETSQQLIEPIPHKFAEINIKIHGIRSEDVVGCPRFCEFWQSISESLHPPLVAHNTAFDIDALVKTLAEDDQRPLPWPYFCTLRMAKEVWPELHSYGLDFLARQHGLSLHHHVPEDDARVCAELAILMCRECGVGTLEELAECLCLEERTLEDKWRHVICGESGRDANPATTAPEKNIELEVHTPRVVSRDGSLEGRRVVFTLKLATMERKEAVENVRARGGTANVNDKNVNTQTDFLVVGSRQGQRNLDKNPTRKMLRARDIGVEILTEEQFLEMI